MKKSDLADYTRPHDVYEFFEGKITPEDFVLKNRDSTSHLGSAEFYAGLDCLAKRDRKAAIEHFRSSREVGFFYVDYWWPHTLLELLQKDHPMLSWIDDSDDRSDAISK